MRKIFEIVDGERKVRVYWQANHGEYRVVLYVNGARYSPADYFTEDKGDAIDTARAMVKPLKG